ncbi:MAG: TetR/AcrR family transcriptional regulator [Serpentinimonas sp.]|jgi:AcrR family transcriptional regulator|nr:TetR/AcrR family transcriptional regulator [Serpentinimonas sp.]
MTRPPHAKAAVLAAAEAIVKDIGAANLTFDELVRRSGITRGGIVYHFPTKDALLQALVENDLQHWNGCVADKRRRTSGPNADLLAYLQSSTEPDEETSRLCAGLLSAATTSKALNEPWKRYYEKHHADVARASADPVMACLLTLAADGLFWQETLGLSPLSRSERRAVVQRMLELAQPQPQPQADAALPPTVPAKTRRGGTR